MSEATQPPDDGARGDGAPGADRPGDPRDGLGSAGRSDPPLGAPDGELSGAGYGALYARIAPDLAAREQAVRDAEPSLPDPEVLDRALRQALARFHHEAAAQTLAYLRWRVDQARADAQATLAASAAARQARAAGRPTASRPDATLSAESTAAAPADAAADGRPRTFRDGAGGVWSVHEIAAGTVPWAHGPRCLLFGSESAIRRVWQYPPDWRTLSDADLEALSWRV